MADTLLSGYFSLNSDVNKTHDEGDSVVSELLPELTLSMTDVELIDLKRDWVKQWEPYGKKIRELQDKNEDYWLGKQFSETDSKKKFQDNLIFESLETMLPIITRPKGDPLVESDNSELGRALADKTRKMLVYLADTLSYNLKLKQVVRYWALYLLGVMKVGWSMKENDITCVAVRPQKLILDPHATVEDGEYTGYYIGEELEDMASDLVLRFPKKKEFITDKVKTKMGTTLEYVMWTTDEYIFWTLEDEVLAKNKNPHWNYDTKAPAPADEFSGEVPTDENGQPQTQDVKGKNHFKNKKKPYLFFTFFNLGKQPHDDTNLIQQNIPLQDLINKRLFQIDKNADNANGGMLVSGDAFTEEQAGKLSKAIRNGGVGWVPTGNPAEVVMRDSGAQLPAFIYQSLVDYRTELRNIFGTRGSSAQGLAGEKTVGGKMIMREQDTSRTGGIASQLEEFTDLAYNWFVQLMYVYYDQPHFASILGKEKTQEYIQLSNKEMGTKLLVGVKEGSMIPHDPVAERQEALQLWAEKGIDPITFFERLDFPNPREAAKNLFLWLSDPIQLFPDLAQAAAQAQKPEEKPPTETINFKDLPPAAQAQMLAKIGIHIDPQTIMQHNASQQIQENTKNTLAAQQKAILVEQGHQHTLHQKKTDGLVKSSLQVKQPAA